MNNDQTSLKQRKAALKNHTKSTISSNLFKVWLVTLLFLLIFLHFYSLVNYPGTIILSNEAILGIALFLTAYLWVQEIRDRNRLQLLNRELADAELQLELEEIETIATLVLTEEAKDPYVHSHSRLVARYARAIAQALKFDEDRQNIIERAAKLHDLGKLSISDTILKKPSKLTEEEWQVMEQHPKRAIEILKPLEFLIAEKDIILHHHERFDGKGYPDHLKGTEIPVEARIIAVADAFDAMNSQRPYREPLPHQKIEQELQHGAANQFDARVVTAFISLLHEHPEFWQRISPLR